jgi:hypothetical protein
MMEITLEPGQSIEIKTHPPQPGPMAEPNAGETMTAYADRVSGGQATPEDPGWPTGPDGTPVPGHYTYTPGSWGC